MTAEDNDDEGMELWPPTPTSTQPPSPRPDLHSSSLGPSVAQTAESEFLNGSVDESEGEAGIVFGREGMELWPATPTSTQPPSPRPDLHSSSLGLSMDQTAELEISDESVDESEGEDEVVSGRHHCVAPLRWCGCERCLRAFAATLPTRVQISMDNRARQQDAIVRSVAGTEHRIDTLVESSTFLDLYMEARKKMHLPLSATSISLALVFDSAQSGCGQSFMQNEIVHPSRVLCRRLVRGCCFLAIVHRPDISDRVIDEVVEQKR